VGNGLKDVIESSLLAELEDEQIAGSLMEEERVVHQGKKGMVAI
jgi:hypothetical protein